MDKTHPQHSAPLGRQPLPTYTPSLSQQLGAPERVRAFEGAGGGVGPWGGAGSLQSLEALRHSHSS